MKSRTSTYRKPLIFLVAVVALLATARIISAQPPIPHAVMEDDDCLGCHQAGVAGAPRLAWDHVGRGNADCTHCHQITGAPANLIPHPIFGRDDCQACHLQGVGNTPKVSGNHVDYENEGCQDCHTLSPAALEPTPIPSPTPPPHLSTGATNAESCIACHQLVFADEQHVLFTGQPLGNARNGEQLYAGTCARCHGADGTTVVGEEEIVIGTRAYWGTHDDASIIWGIGAGTHGQMTAFAEVYGGPLSWEQILDLAAYIRTWGPLTGPAPAEEGASPTYTANIEPMLAERCGGCHGGIAGLTVTEYDALLAGAETGPVIVPGDAQASMIVQVQSGEHYANLSQAELDMLSAWIAAGAQR